MAKTMNEQRGAIESQQKQAWDENVKNGENFIRKIATEANLPVETDQAFNLVKNGVLDVLHANEEDARKFYYGKDTTVLQKAFDDFKKIMFSGAQRKAAADLLKDKESQDQLPKPPAKGGSVQTEPPEKPAKDLDEAGDRAWETLQAAKR